MTAPVIQQPPYPNIPQATGVPAIFRDIEAPVFNTILVEADIVTVARLFEFPQWGIFTQGGSPVVIPDTVISVDIRIEYALADYQLEGGGFESYDKVSRPFDARVRMVCDGTSTPRAEFINQLQIAAAALDLFVVVTKDAQYNNANIIHVDYRRERTNGNSLVIADVWLQEVRNTVQTQFTNTQDPTGASAVNGGVVQPAAPTPIQGAAIANAPGIG